MARIRESAGVHLVVDGVVKDSSVFTAEHLTHLFVTLATSMNMIVLQGPDFIEVPVDQEKLRYMEETGDFVDEGGITGFCVISKSHMSLHAWPLRRSFSLDVFSCGDFDPEEALHLVREILEVSDDRSHVINRKFPISVSPTIYCITNNVNGKRYIGKSCDPTFRWGHHVWLAAHPENRQHGLLHRAIAKYGAEKFSFHTLEICPTEVAAYEREKYWIEKLETMVREKGYNLHPGGRGGGSGETNAMFGRKHSPESKAKMSAALVGKSRGPKSEATRAAMSRSARCGTASKFAVLTEESVVEIRRLAASGVSQARIAEQFGMSVASISRIVRSKTWKHVS